MSSEADGAETIAPASQAPTVEDASLPTAPPSSGNLAANEDAATLQASQPEVVPSQNISKVEPESLTDNPAADMRNMRRIISEDPEWSLAVVPLLTDLVNKHIIKNFEDNSKIINDLLPQHKTAVLKELPTSLPLKITANLIDDEKYWKRCCKARWDLCDVSAYNYCWKQMLFERNLQHIIEHFVPDKTDPTEFYETLAISANYVKKLDIKQLLPPVRDPPKGPNFDEASDAGSDTGDESDIDHFNFAPVFEHLPKLTELCVVYGVRDCGMNFEWGLFSFTNRDCLQLSTCLAKNKTIEKFKLHRSKVDDDKVRVLISHILDHPSLVELDLSHNIVSDRGARALGKFLNGHSCLTYLNLCDNDIHIRGAQALAHALIKNTTLHKLNLRLNRLSDEGGQAICRSLMKNETLKEINLGSNELTEPSCAILCQVLQHNKVLKSIDLSCNPVGQDGGKQLQEGMEENSSIIYMDLRLTDCGQESEYCINQILEKNKEADRLTKLHPVITVTSKVSVIKSGGHLISQQA